MLHCTFYSTTCFNICLYIYTVIHCIVYFLSHQNKYELYKHFMKTEVALQNNARTCVNLCSYQNNRYNFSHHFVKPLLVSQSFYNYKNVNCHLHPHSVLYHNSYLGHVLGMPIENTNIKGSFYSLFLKCDTNG